MFLFKKKKKNPSTATSGSRRSIENLFASAKEQHHGRKKSNPRSPATRLLSERILAVVVDKTNITASSIISHTSEDNEYGEHQRVHRAVGRQAEYDTPDAAQTPHPELTEVQRTISHRCDSSLEPAAIPFSEGDITSNMENDDDYANNDKELMVSARSTTACNGTIAVKAATAAEAPNPSHDPRIPPEDQFRLEEDKQEAGPETVSDLNKPPLLNPLSAETPGASSQTDREAETESDPASQRSNGAKEATDPASSSSMNSVSRRSSRSSLKTESETERDARRLLERKQKKRHSSSIPRMHHPVASAVTAATATTTPAAGRSPTPSGKAMKKAKRLSYDSSRSSSSSGECIISSNNTNNGNSNQDNNTATTNRSQLPVSQTRITKPTTSSMAPTDSRQITSSAKSKYPNKAAPAAQAERPNKAAGQGKSTASNGLYGRTTVVTRHAAPGTSKLPVRQRITT